MVHTIQVTIPQGFNYCFAAELSYVTILKVEREGLVYSQTNTNSPVPDFKFFYFQIGLIYFRNPAPPGGERVKILYKT